MIAPQAITGQKEYISAWLDNSRTDIEKVFRCSVCGAPMFKYFDSLRVIVPGVIDTGENPLILRCNGEFELITKWGKIVRPPCKTIYWIYRG